MVWASTSKRSTGVGLLHRALWGRSSLLRGLLAEFWDVWTSLAGLADFSGSGGGGLAAFAGFSRALGGRGSGLMGYLGVPRAFGGPGEGLVGSARVVTGLKIPSEVMAGFVLWSMKLPGRGFSPLA